MNDSLNALATKKQPKMTAGNASTIQLCNDFMMWLVWAKEHHPTAPPKIRKKAERLANQCGFSLLVKNE